MINQWMVDRALLPRHFERSWRTRWRTFRRHWWPGRAGLREVVKRRFHRGVVLYTERELQPLGDGIWAVPFTGLWG
jgi:hypothetical protein